MTTPGTVVVGIGARAVHSAVRGPEGRIRTSVGPLPEDFASLEETAQAGVLKAALGRCGAADRRYVLVLPRRQAILREFELPPGDPAEILQMIRFQLERDLPLPLDRVRFSYAIASVAEGRSRITAVAVPNEVLDPILSMTVRAGCRPARIVVSCFGFASVAPAEEGLSALVAAGDGHVEVTVSDGGTHRFSRSAPAPGVAADAVASEVERSLLSFAGMHPDRPVPALFLAGGGPAADALARDLASRLGRAVSVLDPPGGEMEAAAAVAVCASPAALPDLLHPPTASRRFRFTSFHRAGLLTAACAVFGFVASQWIVSAKEGELEEREAGLRKQQPRIDAVKKAIERTNAAGEWGDERYPWIDLLAGISRKGDPGSILVLNLLFEESGTVRLTGKAKSEEAVTGFLKGLHESEFFRDAGVEYRQKNEDKNGYRWSYAIRAELKGFERRKTGKES